MASSRLKIKSYGRVMVLPVLGSASGKVELDLNRKGKEQELLVVFAGRGKDRIDLELTARHRAPATKGKITVRGVLRDRASARVRGLIKIEKKAQPAENFMEKRALLLGAGARFEALPYLEIEADDVRASHAATSGGLDPEQLFYLRSRGLSEKQASALLVEGFLSFAVAGEFGKRLASELDKVKAYALG